MVFIESFAIQLFLYYSMFSPKTDKRINRNRRTLLRFEKLHSKNKILFYIAKIKIYNESILTSFK